MTKSEALKIIDDIRIILHRIILLSTDGNPFMCSGCRTNYEDGEIYDEDEDITLYVNDIEEIVMHIEAGVNQMDSNAFAALEEDELFEYPRYIRDIHYGCEVALKYYKERHGHPPYGFF